MKITDRIKQAIATSGLSQSEVARRCGVRPSAVNQWVNGQTKAPTAEKLMKLSRATGVRYEWLLEGRGGMLAGESGQSPDLLSNVGSRPFPIESGMVPVKGTAQLGPRGFFEALDYPVESGDGHIMIQSQDRDAYGLRVVGNSMQPRIKHNEYVVIEPNHDFVAGDEVLVCTTDGQSMIKTFMYLRDGQYRLDSINDDYEPLYVFEDDVERIQYVGAIVKPSRYSP